MIRSICSFLLVVVSALGLRAQSSVPTVSQQMPARVLVAGGAPVSIRLTDYFSVPGVTGTVVQFDTVSGKYNVELLATDAPKTVANFLNYMNRGAYTNSLIHRAPNPDFVIQGGGFYLDGTSVLDITTDPAVQNEFKVSNTRGTLAMAKTDAGPSTATSQWFVNVTNNTFLDTTNGGFTVFGRVLGTGMTVVDTIAAVPIYDARTQLGSAFGELPLLQPAIATDTLVLVRSISALPVFPNMASNGAVVSYGGALGASGIVTADITASTLTLKPVAAGTTNVNITATDTNNNSVQASFTVTIVAGPLFTTQPVSQSLAAGATGTLAAAASAGATLQWQRNGLNLTNVDSATVNIPPMEPALAGIYSVVATSGSASTASAPAVLGVSTTSKVIGTGTELEPRDIKHPNGNTFDQVLLTGASASITADYSPDPALNQITRMSYIDLDNDIVQVEFSGPGTLSIFLDEMTGPALPTKYNQDVQYVKGHASIVITGATEQTNVSVFTVGRTTALNQSLFKDSETYDGVADIARISIVSANGRFGGIRAANAHFYDIRGHTGIYAPGVTFEGPVNVGNINAYVSASPVLIIGGATGGTRITGGNLLQNNGQPIEIAGITQLQFIGGSDSHGNLIAAQDNYGLLHTNGQNVSTVAVKVP